MSPIGTSFRVASAGPLSDIPDSEANQKLIHRWYLSADSTTLPDQIGTADATDNGTTHVTGDWVDGAARDGDAVDDFIDLTSLGGFATDTGTDHAIALSFQVPAGNTGYFLGITDTSADTNILYLTIGEQNAATGEIDYVLNDDNSTAANATTESTWDDGSPHRLVINKTGADSSDWEIYVDQSSQTTTSNATSWPGHQTDFADPVYMFARNLSGSPSGHLGAIIDDLCIYDDSLTTTEAQSYNNPWT